MLKSKKIVSVLLTLILTVSMCLTAIPTASAASDYLCCLIYAKIIPVDNSIGTYYVEGLIEVGNLGYDKNIVIHYTYNDDSNWYEFPATYFKTIGNKEIWKFELPEFTIDDYTQPVSCTFAIKYEVNGQTYWDNNNGDNYYVYSYGQATIMDLGACTHILESIYYTNNTYSNYISGYIHLKNLGYHKDVKVRYTTDNWQTYQEASAYFAYEANSTTNPTIEAWSFKIDIPTSVTNVKLAVSYTVNGQTHWDNNFGDNYSIDTVA